MPDVPVEDIEMVDAWIQLKRNSVDEHGFVFAWLDKSRLNQKITSRIFLRRAT